MTGDGLLIAVTGGSCSGKTTVVKRMRTAFSSYIHVIDEVASAVLARDDLDQETMSDAKRRALQLEIYARQRDAERAVRRVPCTVTDRSTIDAASYWPEGVDDFWRQVGSGHDAEHARYHTVVWLESCAAIGLYERTLIRTESAEVSLAHGQRLLTLWQGHPRLHLVKAQSSFEAKCSNVLAIVRAVLPPSVFNSDPAHG